jgi:hypothetical protein
MNKKSACTALLFVHCPLHYIRPILIMPCLPARACKAQSVAEATPKALMLFGSLVSINSLTHRFYCAGPTMALLRNLDAYRPAW